MCSQRTRWPLQGGIISSRTLWGSWAYGNGNWQLGNGFAEKVELVDWNLIGICRLVALILLNLYFFTLYLERAYCGSPVDQ